MAAKIKHAVITGATGMIGVALANYLLEQGILVTALVRKNSKKIKRLPSHTGLKKVELDLKEFSSKEALLALSLIHI